MDIKNWMRKHKFTYALGATYRKCQVLFYRFIWWIGYCLRKNHIIKSKYDKLMDLKDKWNGERCFIVATGPSLTENDLKKIKNEYTFAMNALSMKFDEMNWYPTFYGIQDEKVFHKLKETILKQRAHIKYTFLCGSYSREIEDDKGIYFFPRNSYYNATDAYFKKKYHAKFSEDAHAVIYEGFTITYSLIQLAVYLGFKEIYLLGCDCSYEPKDGQIYFVDHGIRPKSYSESGNKMTAAYYVAKEYSEKSDFKIYNATRGGKLEVFPRVNLDEMDLKKD